MSYDEEDTNILPHEIHFATQLGVEVNERFFSQLITVARTALYDLPEGWVVEIYDDPDEAVNFRIRIEQ